MAAVTVRSIRDLMVVVVVVLMMVVHMVLLVETQPV